MKKFIPLEIELLFLENEDVITASLGDKPTWGGDQSGDKSADFGEGDW